MPIWNLDPTNVSLVCDETGERLRSASWRGDNAYWRAQSVIGKVDYQIEIKLEQRLGELFDRSWVCKVQLLVRLESVLLVNIIDWSLLMHKTAYMARKSASCVASCRKSGSLVYKV